MLYNSLDFGEKYLKVLGLSLIAVLMVFLSILYFNKICETYVSKNSDQIWILSLIICFLFASFKTISLGWKINRIFVEINYMINENKKFQKREKSK